MNPFDALLDAIRQAVREEIAAALKNQPKAKITYDTKEAAEILNVPESWLAQAARDSKIPIVRIGHYVRFRMTDLEKFIEDKKGSGNHG
jgi:excisionase family DNA binding protein